MGSQDPRQKKDESLRVLAEEVEIAVEKAYPFADRSTVEQLASEHFLTAIWDRRVRQWVHLRGPRNLRDAVALALQAEAFYKGEDLRNPQRTRMVTLDQEVYPSEWSDYGTEGLGYPEEVDQVAAIRARNGVRPNTTTPRQLSESKDKAQVTSPKTSSGLSEERVVELIKNALAACAPPQRGSFDKSKMRCRSCNELGHFARECPRGKSQEGNTSESKPQEN